MKFREQLIRCIQESELSQNEVARRAGVLPSVVSRFVRGERMPGAETIEKLVDFFDLELRPRKKGRTAKAVPAAEPKEGGE